MLTVNNYFRYPTTKQIKIPVVIEGFLNILCNYRTICYITMYYISEHGAVHWKHYKLTILQ